MGRLIPPAEVLRRRREAAEAVLGQALDNLATANAEVKAAFESLCAAQHELNAALAECVAFDNRKRLQARSAQRAPRLARMAEQQRALKDARQAMMVEDRAQQFPAAVAEAEPCQGRSRSAGLRPLDRALPPQTMPGGRKRQSAAYGPPQQTEGSPHPPASPVPPPHEGEGEEEFRAAGARQSSSLAGTSEGAAQAATAADQLAEA